jgi:hypothetical protein
MTPLRHLLAVLLALASTAGLCADSDSEKDKKDWRILFNGEDLTGWHLRGATANVKRYVTTDGRPIVGARQVTRPARDIVRDSNNNEIKGARVVTRKGKKVPVDSSGRQIKGARVVRTPARTVIVDRLGKEYKGARLVTDKLTTINGWTVQDKNLVNATPSKGNDLVTDENFTDFELHVEFLAIGNSGVFLQGRYEVQIDDSYGVKPKKVKKGDEEVEEFDKALCGAINGKIAPSKNMAKKSTEWQTFDITFRAPRGKGGRVTEKARVTVVWNGEKVIDDAEIDGPTAGALDARVLTPGPIVLQGDQAKASFRNLKIRPLQEKSKAESR